MIITHEFLLQSIDLSSPFDCNWPALCLWVTWLGHCFKYNRYLGFLWLLDLNSYPRALPWDLFKSNNHRILGVYLVLIYSSSPVFDSFQAETQVSIVSLVWNSKFVFAVTTFIKIFVLLCVLRTWIQKSVQKNLTSDIGSENDTIVRSYQKAIRRSMVHQNKKVCNVKCYCSGRSVSLVLEILAKETALSLLTLPDTVYLHLNPHIKYLKNACLNISKNTM